MGEERDRALRVQLGFLTRPRPSADLGRQRCGGDGTAQALRRKSPEWGLRWETNPSTRGRGPASGGWKLEGQGPLRSDCPLPAGVRLARGPCLLPTLPWVRRVPRARTRGGARP